MASGRGYWWLCWTWQNHLFACATCNSGYKSDLFGLESDTRLADLDNDLTHEEQTIIDPAAEDPLDHIEFIPLAGKWVPTGHSGSARGLATVTTLGLHLERADQYVSHVETQVKGVLRALDRAIASGDAAAVTDEWNFQMSSLFAPLQPYHALSYWALRHLAPAAGLNNWGLAIPRPGTTNPQTPSVDRLDPPRWAGLPADLVHHLRAIGLTASLSKTWMDRCVLACCRHTPQTVAELAALTGKTATGVDGAVQRLLAAGKLADNAGILEAV